MMSACLLQTFYLYLCVSLFMVPPAVRCCCCFFFFLSIFIIHFTFTKCENTFWELKKLSSLLLFRYPIKAARSHKKAVPDFAVFEMEWNQQQP